MMAFAGKDGAVWAAALSLCALLLWWTLGRDFRSLSRDLPGYTLYRNSDVLGETVLVNDNVTTLERCDEYSGHAQPSLQACTAVCDAHKECFGVSYHWGNARGFSTRNETGLVGCCFLKGAPTGVLRKRKCGSVDEAKFRRWTSNRKSNRLPSRQELCGLLQQRPSLPRDFTGYNYPRLPNNSSRPSRSWLLLNL
ncbi:hypothetical protein KFL_000120325 [Klebsormidium nitens]|uniref:Uncharacterized protein n=1 Tax=Klebsormidium nitens TaxID=105231 RepID=A0A1Y1HP51_KLENI|nr:hypothetical protein KFL_000120325 [Klebsormidium nitens]|eukprot:GAQ78386.1 hypothetical protein KFL_000120325 [Klebsormidium nitens]